MADQPPRLNLGQPLRMVQPPNVAVAVHSHPQYQTHSSNSNTAVASRRIPTNVATASGGGAAVTGPAPVVPASPATPLSKSPRTPLPPPAPASIFVNSPLAPTTSGGGGGYNAAPGVAAPGGGIAPTTTPQPTMATIPPPTFASPSQKTPSVPLPQQQQQQQPSSLESLADAFFLKDSPTVTPDRALRPSPLPVEEGMKRILTLVERRAWGDVLQVCSDLLTKPNSMHQALHNSLLQIGSSSNNRQDGGVAAGAASLAIPPPVTIQKETVKAIMLRFVAMLKLRRYAELGNQVESLSLLELDRLPSWVPWSLKIVAAETLQYTDSKNPQRCIDALHAINDSILSQQQQQHSSSASSPASSSAKQWLSRVHHGLANSYCRQREWRLALVALREYQNTIEYTVQERMVRGGSRYDDTDTTKKKSILLHSAKTFALSRQGRILLQVGALPEASLIFQRAQEEWQKAEAVVASNNSNNNNSALVEGVVGNSSSTASALSTLLQKQQGSIHIQMNQGLLHFAHAQYEASRTCWNTAMEMLRVQQKQQQQNDNNTHTVNDDDNDEYMSSMFFETPLMTECVNNAALCSLYTCRMHDAVDEMEALVRQNPTLYLTEGLAFNLCTLYELGADQTTSGRRKRTLQLISKRFFLHDIGPESFRIT